MKIKPEQIERLIDHLLKNYRDKDMIALKTDEAMVRGRMGEIITKNFREEEAIEEEAREMLATHAGEASGTDQHKMFILIKQKIAQKRGFVL